MMGILESELRDLLFEHMDTADVPSKTDEALGWGCQLIEPRQTGNLYTD